MKGAGTTDRIDKLLELSTAGWSDLPIIVAEIDTWDFDSLQTYLAEEPLEEDRLAQLARYADGGQMDDAQTDRYRRLLRLVRENRPLLDGIVAGSTGAWRFPSHDRSRLPHSR